MNRNQKILNADVLKKVTGEFDLASITELNVKSLGVTDLDIIQECTGLIYLDISGNQISNVQALEPLKNLTSLNLSCNTISSLVGLEGLESLIKLNLAGNMISSIDSLQALVNLTHLKSLQLKDISKNQTNPVCEKLTNYKSNVCSLLPTLSFLDGTQVCESGIFERCDNLVKRLDELDQKAKKPEDDSKLNIMQELNNQQKRLLNKEKPNTKVAWSSEQQFKDLLEQCKSLNKDADSAISDAEKALWGAQEAQKS